MLGLSGDSIISNKILSRVNARYKLICKKLLKRRFKKTMFILFSEICQRRVDSSRLRANVCGKGWVPWIFHFHLYSKPIYNPHLQIYKQKKIYVIFHLFRSYPSVSLKIFHPSPWMQKTCYKTSTKWISIERTIWNMSSYVFRGWELSILKFHPIIPRKILHCAKSSEMRIFK